jgi:hypothetical protein
MLAAFILGLPTLFLLSVRTADNDVGVVLAAVIPIPDLIVFIPTVLDHAVSVRKTGDDFAAIISGVVKVG